MKTPNHALVLLVLANAACSLSSSESRDPPSESAEAEIQTSAIEATKNEIKALGFATAGNKAARKDVRTIFDDRIAKLRAGSPASSEDEKLTKTRGAWHQIWSDEENPQVQQQPGVTAIESQIYQVILPNGVGFNFGLRAGPFGSPGSDGNPSMGEAIFIIRFEVSQGATSKIVTFTNTYARRGSFVNLEKLDVLGKSIDDCSKGADPNACLAPVGIRERQAPQFPQGPIGSQSPLLTDYIDGDFRVVTVPNSVTGHLDLFILERTEAPVLDLSNQRLKVEQEKNRLKSALRQTTKTLQAENDRSETATSIVKPIFRQLSLLAPPDADIDRQLESLRGAWRLLWSNEKVPTDTQLAPGRVYQLVTANHVFNLGERPTPQGPVVFGLRTPIRKLEGGFQIKFDQAYLRGSGFRPGEDLGLIASALEGGPTSAGFALRDAPTFPNGPIGATDDLRNIVLDGAVRVTQGTNASTGAEEIFVLERAGSVE